MLLFGLSLFKLATADCEYFWGIGHMIRMLMYFAALLLQHYQILAWGFEIHDFPTFSYF